MRKTTLVVVTVLLCAGSASASDGVVEINHTCATSTGCFSGDSAGYPVSINGTAGHSYLLTGDLVAPDLNTNAITVAVDNVSIDLNGFEILGPVTCTGAGATLSCSGSGSGSGVDARGVRGVSVRNGSIRGAGRVGAFLGPQSQVRNLRVRWSGIDGISTLDGSTVSENTLLQNDRHGIVTSDGATVSRNASRENGADGFDVGWGSTISGNAASLNGDDGFQQRGASMYHNNTSTQNTGYGFECCNPITFDDGAHGNVTTGNTAGSRSSSVALRDLGGNLFN
jgi:hypothetical protein